MDGGDPSDKGRRVSDLVEGAASSVGPRAFDSRGEVIYAPGAMADDTRAALQALVEDFAERLVAATERAMAARVYAAINGGTLGVRRGPGRPPGAARGVQRRRRVLNVSPARRRQMQAQGRYISTLRRLGSTDRA